MQQLFTLLIQKVSIHNFSAKLIFLRKDLSYPKTTLFEPYWLEFITLFESGGQFIEVH